MSIHMMAINRSKKLRLELVGNHREHMVHSPQGSVLGAALAVLLSPDSVALERSGLETWAGDAVQLLDESRDAAEYLGVPGSEWPNVADKVLAAMQVWGAPPGRPEGMPPWRCAEYGDNPVVERGPPPASPVPWETGAVGAFVVLESSVGGPGQRVWSTLGREIHPQSDHDDTPGTIALTGGVLDAVAIVHRVNNWDGICERLEAVERECERLRGAIRELDELNSSEYYPGDCHIAVSAALTRLVASLPVKNGGSS